ncbi:MAG: hypothetical protein ACYDAD_01295 [Acidimicrobiales bacterium]
MSAAGARGARLRAIVGLSTLMLVAAACGGGRPKTQTATVPLEEQLGLANFGEAPPLQEALVIRDCMKAQGFDYVPVDPAAQNVATGTISEADLRKLYGYDVSTRYGQPPPPTAADPNATIRASLGPADQAAYDRALTGASTDSSGGGGGGGGSFRTVGGCTKDAIRQVYGGAQVVGTLLGKLHELNQRVDNDQRVVRANQDWSQCMQKAGFRYTKPGKIKKDLKKKLKAIVGSSPTTTVASATAPAPPAPAYDHAALAALQKEEMSISAADLACNTKVGLKTKKDAVQREYEAAFRQQNAPLLAKVKVPGAKG